MAAQDIPLGKDRLRLNVSHVISTFFDVVACFHLNAICAIFVFPMS
jgi:hypothetical protein